MQDQGNMDRDGKEEEGAWGSICVCVFWGQEAQDSHLGWRWLAVVSTVGPLGVLLSSVVGSLSWL